MKKKLLTLFLSVMSALFVFGAKASASTISVVSDTAYAPFEFKDSDQTYKGIDVDIINEVAKRKNWDVNQTYPGFDAAVNAVQSGQADALMAGTTVTDARKKVFTFSDTYYDTSIVIYTRSNDKVSDYKQLKGKTVGVKNGTAAQTWLDKNASKYGFTVKTFDTSDLMNNSLDSGSVYAAMDDTPVVQYAIGQGKDYAINIKPESIGSFAFAVKKGGKHESLIKDFNEALKEMKEDGTYDEIMTKWLGDSAKASSKSSSSKPSEALNLTGDANAKATPTKETYTIFKELTVCSKDDTVSNLTGKSHFVSNDNHGHTLLCQFFHNVKNVSDHLRVKGRSRFVKEHDVRIHCQTTRNCHTLFLSTR